MGEFNLEGLNRIISSFIRRAENPEPALREVGFLMAQDMKKNIDEGGRPTRWPPSIRARVTGGQTLRDTGQLMNSITSEVQGRTAIAGPDTSVSFKARILALGGTIKAKNKPFLMFRIPGGRFVQKKEVTIPARDYTYISDETGEAGAEIVQRHVLGE